MTTKHKKLTEQEKAFVREYLVDLNVYQAQLRAGYAETTAKRNGYKFFARPHIQAAVQAQMDKRAQRTEITADYVLSTIKRTVDRCEQAVPVMDSKGKPVMVKTSTGEIAPAYAFDAAGVFRGCELLGKHLKLFTEKVEHGGTGKDGAIVIEIVKFGQSAPAA